MKLKLIKDKLPLETPDDWAIVNEIAIDCRLDSPLSKAICDKYPLMKTALQEAIRNRYVSTDYGTTILWKDPITGRIIINAILYPAKDSNNKVNPKIGNVESVLFSLKFKCATYGIRKIVMPVLADGKLSNREVVKTIKDKMYSPTKQGLLAIFTKRYE